MSSDDNDALRAAIDARLLRAAAAAPKPPSWFRPWYRLRPHTADEDRLAVYQAVRDAGSVPAEATFFLISWVVDAITLADAEHVLGEQQDRLAEIKLRHGLQVDDDWPPGEVPDEYEEAQQEFFASWDQFYAEQLEAHGEPDMARIFLEDREHFERLSEAGREFFARGVAADTDLAWLEALRADVAACLSADNDLGRLEMLHDEAEGTWQVTVYPTADGLDEVPDFDFDLERLRAAFATIAESTWHMPGDDDPLGPTLQIKGVYRERPVLLTLLSRVPDVDVEDE